MMKAWTDYPIEALGDEPYKKAPVRECEVISYDQDKYCKVIVNGINEEIKAGYLYRKEGRWDEVPCITKKQLAGLPKTIYED